MRHAITYDKYDGQSREVAVTVFPLGGLPLSADDQHPNFRRITTALINPEVDEAEVVNLFDLGLAINDLLQPLSERISVAKGRLYIDGDEHSGGLFDTIVAYYKEGHGDLDRLLRFTEKVLTNENRHSRENLYRWLSNQSLQINADGLIVGYKGVIRTEHEDGTVTFLSTGSGTAMVNGVVHSGQIPTFPGAVVTMPRSEVQHDPSSGCSTGLHVGTLNYARGYGNTRVEVFVDPRDVVSVPTDSGDAKMRVCRYIIGGIIESAALGIEIEVPEGLSYDDDQWGYESDEPTLDDALEALQPGLAEAVNDFVDNLRAGVRFTEDDLLALGITTLRKMSRGKVKDGYSLKKKALVKALLAAQ